MSNEIKHEKKKSNWLQTALIGIVAFLFGILVIFLRVRLLRSSLSRSRSHAAELSELQMQLLH